MLQVTKKNGRVVFYDKTKMADSMLKANTEVDDENLSLYLAESIADTVIGRLVATNDIISTQDIRFGVYRALCGHGLVKTANRYLKGKQTGDV